METIPFPKSLCITMSFITSKFHVSGKHWITVISTLEATELTERHLLPDREIVPSSEDVQRAILYKTGNNFKNK